MDGLIEYLPPPHKSEVEPSAVLPKLSRGPMEEMERIEGDIEILSGREVSNFDGPYKSPRAEGTEMAMWEVDGSEGEEPITPEGVEMARPRGKEECKRKENQMERPKPGID